MNRRRWTIGLATLALLLAIVAAGWWRFVRAVPVPAVTVAAGPVRVQVVGPGTVQARVPVTLSARLTSTIVDVSADVGDTVRAGQVLVMLDDRDLAARRAAIGGQQASLERQVEAAQATVAKAQAELELAQLRLARDADLQRQGFVAVSALDAARAAARAAQAALDGARASLAAREAERATLQHEAQAATVQLGHARLRAPMDAVVTQRLAEPGTTVAPGTPILRLVDPATLWVATRVDEAQVARVRPGQSATVRLRSGQQLGARVARVALQSDAATRELDVHVAFDAPPQRVAIDQEAEVRIDVGHDQGPRVPIDALTRDRDGRLGVLRVVEGRTRFAPVATGAADDGLVLVREGLAAGDVIVGRAQGVLAGQRVRPVAP